MTALQHAIDNMTQEVACYGRACDAINFAKRQAELWGFEDVRDGVPRWQREMSLHHAELRALYAQARVEAELLGGHREEMESQP